MEQPREPRCYYNLLCNHNGDTSGPSIAWTCRTLIKLMQEVDSWDNRNALANVILAFNALLREEFVDDYNQNSAPVAELSTPKGARSFRS